jgi:hypothetical protein
VPHTRRVPAVERWIAAATACVVAAGVGIAAASTGGGGSRPAAAPAVASTPTPTPSTASPAPKPSPKPKPKPKPAPKAAPLFPIPAPPAYPTGCPPRKLPPGPPFHPPTPTVATADLPAPVGVPRTRHVDLRAVTGKGMWLTTWPDSTLDAAKVVAQARAAGLRQLWIRTGGTKQGWYGRKFLDALLPRAHAAGIAVIAWDFPALSDPVADAKRAAIAITGTFGGRHIDGFSPDIETIYEGTFNAPRRVAVYLALVRRAAGNLPIIATVMRPTPYQLKTYPYRAEAPYVDVFAPMVYWSCNEPGTLAVQSVRALAKLRPVHLVGQSYDMAPEGGRRGLPSAREIWRFLDAGKRAGAIGASLYVYAETRAPQWPALGTYPWRGSAG